MPPTGPRQTMTGLADDYLGRRRGQLARSTWNSLSSCLHRLSRWWDTQSGRKVPKSMTETDLSRYLWGPHVCGSRCGGSGRWHGGPGLRQSCSDGKFNGDLSRLRAFLEWAVRYGHVRPELLEPVDKSQYVKLKRKRKLQLTSDQIEELITEAPDPWTRIVCALALYTAGRASELIELRIQDVNLSDGVIEWERIKTKDDADYIPITSELETEIEKWLAVYEESCGKLRPQNYLIPRRQKLKQPGGKYDWRYYPNQRRGGTLHVIIKPEISRVTGLPMEELKQEGSHTLRRSMSRALYERLRRDGHGDPIGVVQALLGHAQRNMTERYIGVDSGRIERDSILRGRSMLGG